MTLLAILGAVLLTGLALWATGWVVSMAWLMKSFTGEWPHPLWMVVFAAGLTGMWYLWWMTVGSNVNITFG